MDKTRGSAISRPEYCSLELSGRLCPQRGDWWRRPDDCLAILFLAGGPAGLTAAVYLARYPTQDRPVRRWRQSCRANSRKPQLPRLSGGVSGSGLLRALRKQAETYGVTLISAPITELKREGEGFAEPDTGTRHYVGTNARMCGSVFIFLLVGENSVSLVLGRDVGFGSQSCHSPSPIENGFWWAGSSFRSKAYDYRKNRCGRTSRRLLLVIVNTCRQMQIVSL
jgi:hypothetical protein